MERKGGEINTMHKKQFFCTLVLLVVVSSIMTLPLAIAGKGSKGEPRYNVEISGNIVGSRYNAIYGTQLNGATFQFDESTTFESRIDPPVIITLQGPYTGQFAFYQGHQYCRIRITYEGAPRYRIIHIFVYDGEVIRYNKGDQKCDITNIYD